MSDTIIKVEELSKLYRLGTIGSGTLYRDLQSWWARLRGREDPNSKLDCWDISQMDQNNSFWALNDVSFEVRQGDVIGIIGRNGAGKSTLLKILSRVTGPTKGRIKVKGRIASLLEVGTGFHPELTGRENVYLNGTILGMRKQEIDRKFDEIIEFAEITKFIDTPVKRYSSGMYVKLAFSVAAHLDPEILIVDEVLAVGDSSFQKKCLGKMQDVSKEGRTVLFVSHNMAAIQSLCSTVIWLQNGMINFQGDTPTAISNYLKGFYKKAHVSLAERNDRAGNGTLKIQSINIVDADTNSTICVNSKLKIGMTYISLYKLSKVRVVMCIYDLNNNGIFLFDSDHTDSFPEFLKECGTIYCITDSINIMPGRYFINVAIYNNGEMSDYIIAACFIDVEPIDFYGKGKLPSQGWAVNLLKHRWKVKQEETHDRNTFI